MFKDSYLLEKSINVDVPVDHFLFNPNNSRIFKHLMPLQLCPAICEQVDNSSDIHIHREDFSYLRLSDILREFKRGYYEVKFLPKQLFQFFYLINWSVSSILNQIFPLKNL